MIWNEKCVILLSLSVIDGVRSDFVYYCKFFIRISILRCPFYLPCKAGEVKKFGLFEIKHCGTRHIRDAYDSTILMVFLNIFNLKY